MNRISSTEFFLGYLEERRRHLQREPYYWTYSAYMAIYGWVMR